ncbi:uncharacterized protein VP01_544g12 [Puccinia sorghi]|uniref:Uncharacterized protein n=1 Tax=Puccinia sorghi TaxID=27349 RepID=A0A0L6UJM4_9BASI|nr:uncharacterized protein VP01_544g12 [Puccinia sorghi]
MPRSTVYRREGIPSNSSRQYNKQMPSLLPSFDSPFCQSIYDFLKLVAIRGQPSSNQPISSPHVDSISLNDTRVFLDPIPLPPEPVIISSPRTFVYPPLKNIILAWKALVAYYLSFLNYQSMITALRSPGFHIDLPSFCETLPLAYFLSSKFWISTHPSSPIILNPTLLNMTMNPPHNSPQHPSSNTPTDRPAALLKSISSASVTAMSNVPSADTEKNYNPKTPKAICTPKASAKRNSPFKAHANDTKTDGDKKERKRNHTWTNNQKSVLLQLIIDQITLVRAQTMGISKPKVGIAFKRRWSSVLEFLLNANSSKIKKQASANCTFLLNQSGFGRSFAAFFLLHHFSVEILFHGTTWLIHFSLEPKPLAPGLSFLERPLQQLAIKRMITQPMMRMLRLFHKLINHQLPTGFVDPSTPSSKVVSIVFLRLLSNMFLILSTTSKYVRYIKVVESESNTEVFLSLPSTTNESVCKAWLEESVIHTS